MLEGFQVRGLDQTGLSQKAGPVVSDLCSAAHEQQGSNKAAAGGVDVMLAFDLLGASSDAQLKGASPRAHDRHRLGLGDADGPDGAAPRASSYPQRDRDASAASTPTAAPSCNRYTPADRAATGLFGDSATANVFLVGVAVAGRRAADLGRATWSRRSS